MPARSRPARVRPAPGRTPLPKKPCELVQALRLRLLLTQDEVAERSGGLVGRQTVLQIEAGRNKLTSYDSRRGIAKGLGLTLEESDAFLAEKMTVEKAVELVLAREPALRERVEAQRLAATAS